MNTVPHQKLIQEWKKQNYNIGIGPSKEEDIVSLEEKYDIKLPQDFRSYLLYSCPEPHGGEWDENLISWWPLQDIKNSPDEYNKTVKNLEVDKDSKQYLFFADYCLWAWAWAICCKPGKNYGRIVWIGDGGFVANSFTEFVNIYVERSPDFTGVPED